jgi:phage antirepressor YoqD-like protein
MALSDPKVLIVDLYMKTNHTIAVHRGVARRLKMGSRIGTSPNEEHKGMYGNKRGNAQQAGRNVTEFCPAWIIHAG